MYCSKCGAKNDDDAKFCIACGELTGFAEVNAPFVDTRQGATPVEAKKRISKLPFIIVGIVLLTGIITFVVLFVLNGRPAAKAAKELKLANQYLEEMQYEMAIASYRKAIEIEPNNVEAYEGLANTYVAMAEDVIAIGNVDIADSYYEKAIEALEKGETETGDANLIILKKTVEEKKQENLVNNQEADSDKTVGDSGDDIEEQSSSDCMTAEEIKLAQVGDIVTYGRYGITNRIYEYDTTPYGDYGEKTVLHALSVHSEPVAPIEWIVIANDESGVTLLSKYILDIMPFNYEFVSSNSPEELNWGTSDIRAWLNGDFYNAAFNEEEKNNINTTTCAGLNYADDEYLAEMWPGINDTQDKVFLLSAGEIEQYFGLQQTENLFYDWWENAALEYDEYEAYCNDGSGGVLSTIIPENGRTYWWWLRLPNTYFGNLISVSRNGGIDYIGCDEDHVITGYHNWLGAGGVRPVIRVGL